jgi:hypothetical protein
MTDNELKQRELITAMSILTQQFCQGDMTNGNKDLVVDTIIYLTRQLNDYKLVNNIVICDADLWEE